MKRMQLYLHPKAVARELSVGYGGRGFDRGDDALNGIYDPKTGDLKELPLALPGPLHEWLAGALREGVTFIVQEDDAVEARIGRGRGALPAPEGDRG